LSPPVRALRAASGNREAENGAALGARTVGGFVDAACFDALQDREESRRQHARDGSLTDVRENEVFKERAFLRESARGQLLTMELQPFESNGFESLGPSEFF
jgi:hypothetical protein